MPGEMIKGRWRTANSILGMRPMQLCTKISTLFPRLLSHDFIFLKTSPLLGGFLVSFNLQSAICGLRLQSAVCKCHTPQQFSPSPLCYPYPRFRNAGLKPFDRPRRPLCLLPWIECKHSQQIHLHSIIPTTFFLNCTTDFPTQTFLVCPKSCNTLYTRLHPVRCGKYNSCTL